jgi:hypothetical protein
MNNLLTFLRDPASRTVLAVLALCVSIVVFLVGQWWWRRKALTYTVLETSVLTVHETIRGRVQILFDGEPAKNVSFLLIKLINTGHEPIRASDFERALRFDCGAEGKILTLDVEETNPQNLKPVIKLAGSPSKEFEISPLLLNRGDWVMIKTLVSQMGALTVDGRIAGVKNISPGIEGGQWGLYIAIVIAALLAAALLFVLLFK